MESITRRKQIYEALHPETRNGANQHTRVGQVGQAFADDMAEKTGRSARDIRRDATRGERIGEDVLTEVRGTALDAADGGAMRCGGTSFRQTTAMNAFVFMVLLRHG